MTFNIQKRKVPKKLLFYHVLNLYKNSIDLTKITANIKIYMENNMPIQKKRDNYEHLRIHFKKLKLLKNFYNFDNAFLGKCLTYSLKVSEDKNTYNYFMNFLKSKKLDSIIKENDFNIDIYKPLLCEYIDLFKEEAFIIQSNAIASFEANYPVSPGTLTRTELSSRNQELSKLKKSLKVGAILNYQFFKDREEFEKTHPEAIKVSICHRVRVYLEFICLIVSLYLNDEDIQSRDKELLKLKLDLNLATKNTKEKKIKI